MIDDPIDLTGVTLDELRTLDDTALTEALRRILAEVDDAAETVAGFQSSIG